MNMLRSRNVRLDLLIALAAASAVVLTACTTTTGRADDGRRQMDTPASRLQFAPDNRPQRTPQRALEALLAAERRGDFGASYVYVVHTREGGLTQSESQWRRARRDLPRATDFTVEAAGNKAIATVEHRPTLDPFVGLVASFERQTWSAVRAGDGWLLKPQPRVEPEYASDAGAVGAARDWYGAVQRCDESAAERVQALTTLFDMTSHTPRLCGVSGVPRLESHAIPLPAGPISGGIVAQFSNSALQWGRVVRVVAPVPLAIVLAPIGDAWKVIGIGDSA